MFFILKERKVRKGERLWEITSFWSRNWRRSMDWWSNPAVKKKQKSDKNINLNLRYKIQGFSVIPLESEECSASVQISASLHCTKDDIFGWLQFWYTNIHFVEQDQLEGKTQSSLWDTVLCMVLSQEVDRTFLLWGVHKSKVGLQSPHHQVV